MIRAKRLPVKQLLFATWSRRLRFLPSDQARPRSRPHDVEANLRSLQNRGDSKTDVVLAFEHAPAG